MQALAEFRIQQNRNPVTINIPEASLAEDQGNGSLWVVACIESELLWGPVCQILTRGVIGDEMRV